MNKHGQALIEVTVFFMVLSILMGGFCGFTKWFVVRQKLLIAVREGAFLYSSGHMTRSEVQERMRTFLESGTPKLDPSGIYVSVGPVKGISSSILELDQAIARYSPPGGWHPLLGVSSPLEEKCVLMHAQHYWAPILPLGGPAVSYGH